MPVLTHLKNGEDISENKKTSKQEQQCITTGISERKQVTREEKRSNQQGGFLLGRIESNQPIESNRGNAYWRSWAGGFLQHHTGQESMSKKSAKSPNRAGASLPLLDDVNELIEKEKLLLEFKVLEQQREAQEWKMKYDQLLGKVSDNISEKGDYKFLEVAAEVEETAAVSASSSTSNGPITQFIKRINEHFILDMSEYPRDYVVSQLTEGGHILKGYHPHLKIVCLRNCGLTEANSQLLCSLVAHTDIEAFDFSGNELGVGFETMLFDALMVSSR
jgi:hypothetical protein